MYTEHLGLLKRDAKRPDQQFSVACIQPTQCMWNWHCAQHRARQHQGEPASGGRWVTETDQGDSVAHRRPLNGNILAHVGRKGPTHVGNCPREIHYGARLEVHFNGRTTPRRIRHFYEHISSYQLGTFSEVNGKTGW
jgi:hypothetical protein